MTAQRIPNALRAGILALFALTGTGAYIAQVEGQKDIERTEYVQAVAADDSTDMAIKIAMVMGSYYESSYKHIGTPYIDRLGKGQPMTVCNGITGRGVVAGKWYSPADCYALEKGRYIRSAQYARANLKLWDFYTDIQRATFIDFIHNKGETAFLNSTMRAKANNGDITGACRENVRWNKGTVSGLSVVLPGLKIRGDSNADLCEFGMV